MECFNCLTPVTIETETKTKCFCSEACRISTATDVLNRKITTYENLLNDYGGRLVKVIQTHILILKGCAKRSKKEQLIKLKAYLQDAMVNALEYMETDRALMLGSDKFKFLFEEATVVIDLFGSA